MFPRLFSSSSFMTRLNHLNCIKPAKVILAKSDKEKLEVEISMGQDPEAEEYAMTISKTTSTSGKEQVACQVDKDLINNKLKTQDHPFVPNDSEATKLANPKLESESSRIEDYEAKEDELSEPKTTDPVGK